MQDQFCVIGSGPSGVAAAHQLLKMGCSVVMIDAGRAIERELAPLTKAGGDFSRARHLQSVYEARDSHQDPRDQELPMKKPFGSNFAYRPHDGHEPTRENAFAVVSHAVGGLSQAWGANVCRIRGSEMQAWPIDVQDLEEGFETVKEIVDVAGEFDAVDALYDRPLISSGPLFKLGRQGSTFLARAKAHEQKLVANGLHVGRAKIAIGPRYSIGGLGCRSCGVCMHGCPYQAIYNSANTLAELRRHARFTYLPQKIVLKFSETSSSVNLDVKSSTSDAIETLEFKKVFVAAGTLGSTTLVARSMNWCHHTFIIKDSQKYLFPYFRFSAPLSSWSEPAMNLAQIFLQTKSENGFRLIHGQLYGYNDLLFEPLRKKLGPLLSVIQWLATPFLDRLLIGMIYLHSDDSGHMEFRVDPDPKSGIGRLQGVWNAKGDRAAQFFLRRINKFWRELGGFASYTLAQPNRVGESLHFGASLPMAVEPTEGQTDKWGRPSRSARVHVVDTSIFSSIPATPTTYLAMANAIRIAKFAAAGESQ